ncbi:MAG: GNAT family N-acetyltransferase [Anaerolineae bacterium]|jgi:GNAT superfamily N-acetyltransferase
MALEITLSEENENEFAELLQARIREFNNQHSPYHLAARQPGAVRPLRVMLKDEAGQAVGGLSAHTYWDWLEVDDLFVPEKWRGQGIGSSLLQTAEAMAVGRGARHSFLTTFAFQARAFYEKHGYTVAGTLEGYPPGSAYFWMRKDLGPDPGQMDLSYV